MTEPVNRIECTLAYQRGKELPGRKTLGDTVQPDGTKATKDFYEGCRYTMRVERTKRELMQQQIDWLKEHSEYAYRMPWRMFALGFVSGLMITGAVVSVGNYFFFQR